MESRRQRGRRSKSLGQEIRTYNHTAHRQSSSRTSTVHLHLRSSARTAYKSVDGWLHLPSLLLFPQFVADTLTELGRTTFEVVSIFTSRFEIHCFVLLLADSLQSSQ